MISCLIKHLVLGFSLFNLQIPSSHETTDSPVDAIPKTNDGLIDWSQVSKINVPTILIQVVNVQLVCKLVIVFYVLI